MLLLLLMVALLKEIPKRVIKEVVEHIMEIKMSVVVKRTVSTTRTKEGIEIKWRSLLCRAFYSKHIVLSSLA